MSAKLEIGKAGFLEFQAGLGFLSGPRGDFRVGREPENCYNEKKAEWIEPSHGGLPSFVGGMSLKQFGLGRLRHGHFGQGATERHSASSEDGTRQGSGRNHGVEGVTNCSRIYCVRMMIAHN